LHTDVIGRRHAMTQGVSRWSLTTGIRFYPRPIRVGFVVDKVSPEQAFPEYFSFPLSISFHVSSTFLQLSPLQHFLIHCSRCC